MEKMRITNDGDEPKLWKYKIIGLNVYIIGKHYTSYRAYKPFSNWLKTVFVR